MMEIVDDNINLISDNVQYVLIGKFKKAVFKNPEL